MIPDASDFSVVTGERGVMEKKYVPNVSEETRAWVLSCETAFSATLDRVAEALAGRSDIRLIRLSGPTCSGKTTAANLLRSRFEAWGKRLHLVSIDDFYFDKDVLHARASETENGQIDYDSVKTIDLESLRRFAAEIFTAERSHCPIFDFKEGKRIGYRTVESGEADVFLFEGIQAVYPELRELFDSLGHETAGIYIAPQSAVRAGDASFEPNELRLLRRLVRDYNFRGTEPEFTLALWESVRQNEEAHIFPYADSCSYRIDSSMPYEPGILKPFLCNILSRVPRNSRYRAEADRILKRIETIEPLPADLILPGSLYKEFI